MTVAQLKKKLHSAIDASENEALLKAINELLSKNLRHAELLLPGKPMTENTLKSIVAEAEAEYKAGNSYSHDEILKMTKQWGKKKLPNSMVPFS